jgi:hypothetical protein
LGKKKKKDKIYRFGNKKRVLIEGALEKRRENIEKIMYGICGT